MDKKILTIILICSIFIFFSSCDCFRHSSGRVVDLYTDKPIDSVLVEAFLISKDNSIFIKQVYTDTSGKFDIGTGPMGKNGCDDDFVVVFSKKGYKNIIAKDPDDSKITLDKGNNKREYLEKIYKR